MATPSNFLCSRLAHFLAILLGGPSVSYEVKPSSLSLCFFPGIVWCCRFSADLGKADELSESEFSMDASTLIPSYSFHLR